MSIRTGRCLCGAVNFTLNAEPLAVRICWCRDCQHLAANGTVNLLMAAEAVSLSGELASYTKTADSGNSVTLSFCPHCGAHVLTRSAARPHITVVRAGNLDEPSSISPTLNVWTASAPTWACLDPILEKVERQPPAPPS